MKKKQIILSGVLAAAMLASSNMALIQAADDFADVQIEEESSDLGEDIETPDVEETDLGSGEIDSGNGEADQEDGEPEEIQEEEDPLFSDSAQPQIFSDGVDDDQEISLEEEDAPAVGKVAIEYTNAEETAELLRQQLKKRQEDVSVTVRVRVDGRTIEECVEEVSEKTEKMEKLLCKHTGAPSEGDILKLDLLNTSRKRHGQLVEGDGHLTDEGWVTTEYWVETCNYQFIYASTYEQELETYTRLKQILVSLNLADQSDYMKVKKIYEYLCNNVRYYRDLDYCANPAAEIGTSTYAALIEGVTTSEGFARAFYQMALEAGVDTRIVRNRGDDCYTHNWNIVKIGSYYYNLDASCGSAFSSDLSSSYYFLKSTLWSGINNTSLAGYPMADKDYTVPEERLEPVDVTGFRIGGSASDALRLNWNKNAEASGYIIEQKQNGTWTRIKKIEGNSTVTFRSEKLSASTKYDYRIRAYSWDSTSKRSLYSGYTYVSGTTILTNASGLKIGGYASDALRLNWNRNMASSGYIIEQKQNGAWTRIKKIEGNSTVTFRVEKLSAWAKYEFRIRAYSWDSASRSSLYSGYTYVSGRTTPSKVAGLKIGGSARDAIRLNWSRNITASGYIIEQKKNESWVRIRKTVGNTETTLRVEKLNRSTRYDFRIRAYGWDSTEKLSLYGEYTYVSGSTLK